MSLSPDQLRVAVYNPVIVEPKVRVKKDKELQAFSVVDAGSRYEGIAPYLSREELQQLVEQDEVEAVTAHWAEIAGSPVMPYSLVMLNDSVGSLQIVRSQEGKPKPIFRKVTNMLESSIEKDPKNKRSKSTLYSFKEVIQPKLRQLNNGDTLAFFSPPDWGGKHEYEYGFMYLLRRSSTHDKSNATFEGYAVKLDLTKEEYENLIFWQNAQRGYYSFNQSFDELVAKSVYSFRNISVEQVIHNLLDPIRGNGKGEINLLGGKISSIHRYIMNSIHQYEAIRQKMKVRGKAYVNALASGNKTLATKELTRIQQELLWETNPRLFLQALWQASIYGESQVLLPCGIVYLAGGMSENNLALMGITDPENDIWICENCGHVHYIDARNHKLENHCHGCGASGEC